MTVHACPSCGGSSPLGARVCTWCGVTFLSPGPGPAYSVIDPDCARHGHVYEVGKEGCVNCGEGASTQLEPGEPRSTLYDESEIGPDGKRYPVGMAPKSIRSGGQLVPRPNPSGGATMRGRGAADGPDGMVMATAHEHLAEHRREVKDLLAETFDQQRRLLWWGVGIIWTYVGFVALWTQGWFHG